MPEENETTAEEEVNVEEIMQEIRRRILAQTAGPGGAGAVADIPLSGRRLPSDFYDHLYQAGLAINEMHIHLQVTRSTTPLVGPLVDRLRQAVHQVVLFYVHQLVMRQAEVNRHFLRALSTLSEALEQEDDPVDA